MPHPFSRSGRRDVALGVCLLLAGVCAQAEPVGGVPVAEMLMLVAAVALILGIGLCFLFYRIAGGRWLLAVLALGFVLLLRWGSQADAKWQAQEELNAWKRTAVKACETEQVTLPSELDARSLVDTTTGLLWTEVHQLLAERQLSFIELKVAEDADRAQAIIQPSEGSTWVKAPWASKPYVRLRMGTDADPACHPELTAPSWKRAPFLPETCMLAEEIDSPSADLRLERQRARDTVPRELGWRRLVDVKSGQILAQLTSSESIDGSVGGAGDRLTRPGDKRGSRSCVAPQRLLVDLLRNASPDPALKTRHQLEVVEVHTDVDPDLVLERFSVWPRIESAPRGLIHLSRDELGKVGRRSEHGAEAWAEHVRSARTDAQGIAPHGSKLIDLRANSLTRLVIAGQGSHRWDVQPALNGFFVTHESARDGERLLIRFNRKGSMEWAVAIVDTVKEPATLASRGFADLVVDPGEIVLRLAGDVLKRGEVPLGPSDLLVTEFRIPLSALPPIEGMRRQGGRS